MSDRHAAEHTGVPGSQADNPTEIPKEGWLEVVKRAWQHAQGHQTPLLAAGVAFYAFLSIFPGIIAAVMLYGLVVSPATIREHAENLGDAMPAEAKDLVMAQVNAIADQSAGSLSIGLLVSVGLALWSASAAASNLMSALNIAYDEEETRGFVTKKLVALGITLGMIVLGAAMIFLVAVTPVLLSAIDLGIVTRILIELAKWVILFGVVCAGLGVIYKVMPDREDPKFRWSSVGAVVATVVWLVASLAFSIYVANFGSYNKTYGSLAAVVVLLMWLWITFLVILLGAHINAETEAQTAKDTTTGDPEPMGSRGAVKADTPAGASDPPPKR